MKVLGIIAEYNPFHNGHLYHLTSSLELIKPDYIIVAMSGHFTQRGEAAIIDKWERTEMALRNGVDIVIELPIAYSSQTAELFAYGGVQLLNHTGVVTHISFGSEIGEIHPLAEIARILADEPHSFKTLLKQYLNQGLPFPLARHRAIVEHAKMSGLNFAESQWEKMLSSSNSILAIEYLKALYRTKSNMIPVTIKRIGAPYNAQEMSGELSSATAIRNEVIKQNDWNNISRAMPQPSFEILKRAIESGKGPVSNTSLEQLILGKIRSMSLKDIENLMDVDEGLENRIKECALKASTLNEFMSLIKTKRYTYTRLQRILIHALLDITKEKVERFKNAGGPQYLRVLGFSKRAIPLLKQLKQHARKPIITKVSHYERVLENPIAREMFEIDILATNLYSLGIPQPKYRKGNRDFTEKIRIV
ncbi:putative nucleotidyltransferase [Caldicoprobacter guelmensis]|uniref:nucleotidyltransferase n=1 Tax=Caldicoprobacter guelmensis TaxID=1170224 RepID=UPI0019583C16|nr:nucleotidyltransferase [Caldicoprobacter guelmensis]MBM7581916.1 putative nucleotidyltransferase [Caldicoprobacter guelmensis]